MIYPEDYKCLSCKKYHTHGCKYKGIPGMLSCSDFVDDSYLAAPIYPKHLGLMRCLLNVCPQYKLV